VVPQHIAQAIQHRLALCQPRMRLAELRAGLLGACLSRSQRADGTVIGGFLES